mgnify:CR=1 FL=1
MKNKISKLLISMGLLIIIGSLMLISYSKYVDGKALQSFEEKIEKKEVISKVNPGDEIGIIKRAFSVFSARIVLLTFSP